MKLRDSCFAAIYEPVTRRYERYLAPRRESLLSQAAGRIVEIGPGCGANLSYFRNVESWVGIESNSAMRKRLNSRLSQTAYPTKLMAGYAEHLPFANESVDSVVSTLVLCSVRSVEQSLAEITRVLRPGGRLFLLEHTAAHRGSVTCLTQCILRSPWSFFAAGCQLNRALLRKIQDEKFTDLEIQQWRAPFPPVPYFLSPHIMGTATK